MMVNIGFIRSAFQKRLWEVRGGQFKKKEPCLCIFKNTDIQKICILKNTDIQKIERMSMHFEIYLSCNRAHLAQQTIFDQKSPFLPKVFQKVRKSRQTLISQQNSVC